jgi:hypothetical protein
MNSVTLLNGLKALEDAIGTPACSLEANKRVTNGIPLGCLHFLTRLTVNSVQTLKAQAHGPMHSNHGFFHHTDGITQH